MTLLDESERLHERVRRFARGEREDSFESLGLAIARFQASHSPGFARLVQAHGSRLERLDDVPSVPCDAFRLTRVAVHPPELDEVRFATSGTTGAPGLHCMRTTRTYRELSLSFGAQALKAWSGPAVVAALARDPGAPATSSLGFMMRAMSEEFEGRGCERWLVNEQGVDVPGLEAAIATARERGQPLLLLATAFALVALLDALAGRTLKAPHGSTVMQTGGFKGKAREVTPEALRASIADAFAIDRGRVIGEYGMTELTSQLYESPERRGVYLEPAWLRVIPVDPATLEPVLPGEIGVARIVDLGNVDSALVVVAEDLVRREGPGVELCGRRSGAPARGCSLALESLLVGV